MKVLLSVLLNLPDFGRLIQELPERNDHVYENPEYLTGYEIEKINIVYLDGYVERLEKEDFISKLRETYNHLEKEMPEIKFKN